MSGYHVATEHKLALCEWFKSEDAYSFLKAMASISDGVDPNGKEAHRGALELGRGLIATMQFATPYYFSPEVCEALKAAAGALPSYSLRAEDLPTRSGYFFFSRSLPVDQDTTDLTTGRICGDLVAVSWRMLRVKEPEGNEMVRRVYTDRDNGEGPNAAAISLICESEWRRSGIPIAAIIWPFGVEWAEVMSDARWNPNLADGKPLHSDATNMEMKYFASAICFIAQEIFPTRREQLPRDTRKRLARAGFDPGSTTNQPHVVYLRRIARHAEYDEEHERREYSHRFWVRGFWRNQWYETEQRHKPKWIHPFIKGPEDKPIAPRRDTLVAVVR